MVRGCFKIVKEETCRSDCKISGNQRTYLDPQLFNSFHNYHAIVALDLLKNLRNLYKFLVFSCILAN